LFIKKYLYLKELTAVNKLW